MVSPDTLVRIARESDAGDVAGLTAQLGYDVEASVMRSRLCRIVVRSEQLFLIAEQAGQSVGWVHAAIVEYVETGPFVVVAGLVIDKSMRKRGIGRLLMQYVEKWSQEQGVFGDPSVVERGEDCRARLLRETGLQEHQDAVLVCEVASTGSRERFGRVRSTD